MRELDNLTTMAVIDQQKTIGVESVWNFYLTFDVTRDELDIALTSTEVEIIMQLAVETSVCNHEWSDFDNADEKVSEQMNHSELRLIDDSAIKLFMDGMEPRRKPGLINDILAERDETYLHMMEFSSEDDCEHVITVIDEDDNGNIVKRDESQFKRQKEQFERL